MKHKLLEISPHIDEEFITDLYRKSFEPVSKDDPLFSPEGKRWVWYIDLKGVLVSKKYLTPVTEAFVKIAEEKGVNVVAGMGMGAAGMIGAMVQESENIDGIIIRDKPKLYGNTSQIHGMNLDGNVCIIDDLMNSGNSNYKSIRALRRSNIETKFVFNVFEFGEKNKGRKKLEAEGIEVISLAKLVDNK